jgi:hypothetical protein
MPIHATLLPGLSFNDAALFLYIAIARWQHSVVFTVFARWCEKSEMALIQRGLLSINHVHTKMLLVGNHFSIPLMKLQ